MWGHMCWSAELTDTSASHIVQVQADSAEATFVDNASPLCTSSSAALPVLAGAAIA